MNAFIFCSLIAVFFGFSYYMHKDFVVQLS